MNIKELTYKGKALKGLKKMPKTHALKMATALKKIAMDDTASMDIKKLQGMEGFRLRIGKFRAVYTIDMVFMTVVNIGPRGRVYERK